MHRGQWRPKLIGGEQRRGWILLGVYILLFPFGMALVQRLAGGLWPAAEANAGYYLLLLVCLFLLLRRFLRQEFELLLDWLPENCFAMASGCAGAVLLSLLTDRLPYPVEDLNSVNYAVEYLLSPWATVVLVVVLIPITEEILFRGVFFGGLRSYSRVLAYVLSVLFFSLNCVWQFAFSASGVDLRYLLLAVRYLPLSLALTWCYDVGGSVWSPILLHGVLNGLTLWRAVTA